MDLHGRKPIYTNARVVDESNLLDVLHDALSVFSANQAEEKYLYDYYKGKQEIRYKQKQTRPEINHIVTENRCFAITDFKTGYICGDPIVYTSRSSDRAVSDKISDLNDYMAFNYKASLDKELFDWMHITGHGYRMVLPDAVSDAKFSMVVVEPMSCFVIKSSDAWHRTLAGVYITMDEERNTVYSVYTPVMYFEVVNDKIIKREPHTLGVVPIFEFALNEARMGSFEPVIELLDAINYVDSDRLDGITQFINSLCVLYNAELPDGETSDTIRDKGLICLKSVGENKADIKIMTEQLDQNATQTLKDDLYNTVLQIVGMPNQSDASTADSSNNGAMFLKQGYQLAETRAKGEELAYKRVHREETKLVLSILRRFGVMDIDPVDVDVTFTRRAYSDIVSKSTVLTTMLNNPLVNPLDAWSLSGISPDPEESTKRGLEWYENNAAKMEKDDANNEPVTD